MTGGRPGVLHGNRTYLLQDADGQILEGHSISAGLDYPASARSTRTCTTPSASTYVPITDNEALEAFQLCTRLEGIIPALGILARPRPGDEARADHEQGRNHRPLPLGSRRQGRGIGWPLSGDE